MRNGSCGLCLHNEVIDTTATEFSGKFHREVPLAVTHRPDRGTFVQERAVDHPIGVLHMLVCRKCGFVQWYAEDPQNIPISDVHGTRLISAPRAGYR